MAELFLTLILSARQLTQLIKAGARIWRDDTIIIPPTSFSENDAQTWELHIPRAGSVGGADFTRGVYFVFPCTADGELCERGEYLRLVKTSYNVAI